MLANRISSDRIVRLMALLLIGFVVTPVALPQLGGGAPQCRGCAGVPGTPDSASDAETYIAIYVIVENGVCRNTTSGLSCHEEACSATFVCDWQTSSSGPGFYCDPGISCEEVPLPPPGPPVFPPGLSEGQVEFVEEVGCDPTPMQRTWQLHDHTVFTWAECTDCKRQHD